MKKRFRNQRGIDIDLTSLLDVIFIVLLVVLCHQQIGANQEQANLTEIEAQLTEAQDALQDAQAEAQIYEDRLDTYDNLNDQVRFLNIYVDYRSSDITHRYIRIMEDNNPIETIELTPDNQDEKFEEFRKRFIDYVKEDENKPVICSINREHILYRDEVRMNQILAQIDSRNLFYK